MAPKQKEYNLRSRPDIRKPDRYDPSKQLPIILKGDVAQFASMDLIRLVSRLPDIHDGAEKWIRVLEEETVGKILALGDIKAIFAKVLGTATMQNVLKNHPWMLQERADGIEFNVGQTAIWAALRAEFPNKVDPVARQLRRWKEDMESGVNEFPMIAAVFPKSIVDVMPQPVRTKLEDVVALMSMPHKEFRDHVVRAIEKYRRDEQKLTDQDKNIQRKLAQLQLGELQSSSKTRTQAAVVRGDQHPSPNVANLPNAVSTAPQMYPPAPQITQPSQPVVNVYPQPWNSRPFVPRGRQQRSPSWPNRGRGGPTRAPGACWTCDVFGHRSDQCRNGDNSFQRRPRGRARPGPPTAPYNHQAVPYNQQETPYDSQGVQYDLPVQQNSPAQYNPPNSGY
ncbi:uncharacterized protein LOC114133520 [Xiphophorus couchianus]|uniref:uncharacterized protein LOC114133520 n=1 Tax=Xiphophorus couchianus TaxID=32473 RepID=UPI001015EB42|nr:uncharacterized protein LOC114133520 [Xiphophorus couchianus]